MRPIILHFHVIHVKVSSCSWCTRTLLMNVAIDSEHCDCERILCKDWVWLKMCGKRSRMWPKQEHGIKVWYFDSWTWCKKSCDIWRWSLVPPRLVSHCSACEWSHMEAIVHMANSWMGSMCVVSLFGEEYGFVVKCNICSIVKLELQHSPMAWYISVAKRPLSRGIYGCIMEQAFFRILHRIGTQNFAFICLLDLFACFPCNSRKSMRGTFLNL